jgi:hypothetical protein
MTIEVEGVVIGIAVRGDGPSREFARAVESMRCDRDANHNYSVWLSGDRRVFQRLQWGGCTVVRTRDPNRFGRALALHLSGHGAPSAGLMRTDGVVAVHDGRATVLPVSLRQSIPTYERPLREAGVILHDAPRVDVDPHTGEVVLEAPRLAAAHFDEVVDRLPPAPRREPIAEPGRYPLAGWYFTSLGLAEANMSTADAVAAVLTGLRSRLTHEDQPAAVAAMFERIPFGRLRFLTPRHLLDQMRT